MTTESSFDQPPERADGNDPAPSRLRRLLHAGLGARATRRANGKRALGSTLVMAAFTLATLPMRGRFDLSNVMMVYLLGVVVTAIAFGRLPAILAAILSVLLFDFAFVPPRFTLRVADAQYLVTFAVMLAVAVVTGTLTAWLREQLELARVREHRAAALYRLTEVARRSADSERTRSALLSSVSHDLRTPLAAITGAATSLRDGGVTESARRELAEMIAGEAQRLNRLIGNLLDMTLLESGSLRIRREWHSLEEIVGSALGGLEPILGTRPVEVHLPDDLPLVSVDETLLGQLVRNLVENAAKYSDADAPIDLLAATQAGALRLEVLDRGPGIPPGDESRVFEKFYRGHHATGPSGAGLGLAICRAIAEVHGGSITAATRAGGGAAFTVTLPLEGEPPSIEAEPSEAASGEIGSRA